MGFVIAISVLPLVWVVISSLETNAEILSSALNLPAQPSLKGYATAFRFARLDLKFVTSLIVAVSTTTISLLIYSLCGLCPVALPLPSAHPGLHAADLLDPDPGQHDGAAGVRGGAAGSGSTTPRRR